MANALGTLFKDIADAIRGKTGSTKTMKPAEFPSAIAGIITGGEMTGVWKSVSGKFTAESEVQTITHELGVVPDMIVVTAAHAPGPQNIIATYGLSQRILDSGKVEVPATIFLANEYGTIAHSVPTYGVDNMDELDSNGNPKYCVRYATATSFTVGAELITKLSIGKEYYYTCLALT